MTNERPWKMVCTSDPTHSEFITVSTVEEDWRVDAYGNFIEVVETKEIIRPPTPEFSWDCAICGAEAKQIFL